MFLGLLDWSDFQDFLFVAKKLLKTLQTLRKAKVSSFLIQIQNQHHYPHQNKTLGIPLWFLPTHYGEDWESLSINLQKNLPCALE